MYLFRKAAVFFLLIVLAVSQALPCYAKTVAEWQEGYQTGKDWFGEDMTYDITDEAACWELLQRPITVLNAKENEKIYPRETPNGDKVNTDKQGGFLFGSSSAIHVLGEDEDGWTLIEGMDYYNRIIRGYVRTRLITTATPNETYGIIVDKLTQRLYLFIDGHCVTSLLVSTGHANDKQPYNETSAGEYLIMSWVGQLADEGMYCDLAMRYNGGDMIHQVPYRLNGDGSKNFSYYEAYLGQKASHGCIRVQQAKNADGYNAQWLWDHLKKYTKVIIWDDAGRAKPYPDENATVYYNPDGGDYYHAVADCSAVKAKYLPLSPITYGDLESGAFSELEACKSCHPSPRISEIAKDNYERGVIDLEEYRSKLTPLSYPDEQLQLYYNPNGGSYYHSTAYCSNVKSRYLPLTAFSYGELDTGSFAKLKACSYCKPVKRKAEIDAENEKMGFTALDVVQEQPETEQTGSVTIEILD